MSSLFGKPPTPKVDKSALVAAEEQKRKANEAAQAAEAKKLAIDEDNKRKKKNVSASGRESTILAGETGERKTMLGS